MCCSDSYLGALSSKKECQLENVQHTSLPRKLQLHVVIIWDACATKINVSGVSMSLGRPRIVSGESILRVFFGWPLPHHPSGVILPNLPSSPIRIRTEGVCCDGLPSFKGCSSQAMNLQCFFFFTFQLGFVLFCLSIPHQGWAQPWIDPVTLVGPQRKCFFFLVVGVTLGLIPHSSFLLPGLATLTQCHSPHLSSSLCLDSPPSGLPEALSFSSGVLMQSVLSFFLSPCSPLLGSACHPFFFCSFFFSSFLSSSPQVPAVLSFLFSPGFPP